MGVGMQWGLEGLQWGKWECQEAMRGRRIYEEGEQGGSGCSWEREDQATTGGCGVAVGDQAAIGLQCSGGNWGSGYNVGAGGAALRGSGCSGGNGSIRRQWGRCGIEVIKATLGGDTTGVRLGVNQIQSMPGELGVPGILGCGAEAASGALAEV